MSFPTEQLAKQQEAVRVAHVRHSGGRSVSGRFTNAYQLWRKLYEARAALADQNPAFAAKLLPSLAPTAGVALGFPAIPSGVYWQVDKDAPNTVSLTINLAATLAVQVVTPTGTVQTPQVQPSPLRQFTSFAARVDGLYAVHLSAGGAQVATLYIPVMRARFTDFREWSRFLAFDFVRDQNPPAPEPYSKMLATLYAADAAAATGQPELFAELADLAARLLKAPTPIALFSHHV